MFARPHNIRPGWIGLGNQLDGVHITDPELRARYEAAYGAADGSASASASAGGAAAAAAPPTPTPQAQPAALQQQSAQQVGGGEQQAGVSV